MSYILVLMFATSIYSVPTEYISKAKCEDAGKTYKASIMASYTNYVCIPSGNNP